MNNIQKNRLKDQIFKVWGISCTLFGLILLAVFIGDILIDGQSIYESTIHSVRKSISLVSQDTTLFDDTIKNNIKYGRQEATDEEVFKVASLSFCDEFINNLPNKYETLIGENGIRLSGGQKARLLLLLVVIEKPDLLI